MRRRRRKKTVFQMRQKWILNMAIVTSVMRNRWQRSLLMCRGVCVALPADPKGKDVHGHRAHQRSPPRSFSSVHFIRSVVSNSLRPHGLQHARPPCPSPTPGVDSNSCPLSQWCHPTISTSVIPFSSCPQSFPASGSFPMSQLFASGGQTWSFSFSSTPSNEHPGLISLRMDWLDLLAVQETLKSLL